MLNKKIRDIIIGTNNLGKLKEIRDLLPKNYKIYSPKDFGISSPKENGKTFLENSLIKAKYFSKKTKRLCLADDSGIEINILNNQPGIFSARWAGKKKDFNLAIDRIYNNLQKIDKDWKKKRINARFISALTIYGLNRKTIQSVGIIEGRISPKKIGKNGFGYDPIFIPRGRHKTFGQMKYQDKLKIDHRMKAFRKIKKFL